MPVSAEDTQQIGIGILQRIAVREKARLHKEFLTRLYELPQAQNIVLCGSMALHSVYLHKRWSKDLDLEAPKDVALQFDRIAAQAGLHLKLREGQEEKTRLQDAVSYSLSSPSPFYSEIFIGVEVFSRQRSLVRPEHHEFITAVGERILVPVKPLAEILAVKLGCLFRRGKAMDFVDLWFGLSSDSCLRLQIKDLLQSSLCDAGDYTPPKLIDTRLVLDKLARLHETWQDDLSVYLTQVPDFAQVQGDLSRWLPLFDTHARK